MWLRDFPSGLILYVRSAMFSRLDLFLYCLQRHYHLKRYSKPVRVIIVQRSSIMSPSLFALHKKLVYPWFQVPCCSSLLHSLLIQAEETTSLIKSS